LTLKLKPYLGGNMTQIVLENINPDVLEKIRSLAQKHNRSLEDEIKTILAQAAKTEAVEKREINISQAWSKIDEARQRHAGKIFSDSVELLREDRNR
jgi:antitoxin FitA